MKKLIWISLAQAIILISSAQAWSPPWFALSINSGYTDNIFADSVGEADGYSTLLLDMEYSITPSANLYYMGDINRYSQNSDLGSIFQDGGVKFNYSNTFLKDIHILFGLSRLVYNEAFSLYSRDMQYFSSSVKSKAFKNIRFRSGFDFRNVLFPSYDDTVGVDHKDLSGYLGINASLPIPLSLDAKAGLQWRHYGDLSQAVNTLFSFATIRLSGPLGKRMGANVRLQIRKQTSANENELLALYTGGIDPGDLLWDGWYLRPEVNRIIGSWKTSLNGGYRKANYIEASVVN